MRGKKVDANFLSQFISECIHNNIVDQEDIAEKAKLEISEIDEQIKYVEKLKVKRSKLLDVISVFDKTSLSHKEEIKILSFFQMQKPEVCQYICSKLKNENMKAEFLYVGLYSTADVIFCVKQLIEHKVIAKIGDVLVKGDSFNDYIKFVFHEV